MPPQGLNPGDMVVELAGVVSSVAVTTGAVVAARLLWLIKKSRLISAVSFIAGAAIGYGIGQLLAHTLYLKGGNTTVVKAGVASLESTIRAGLMGGVVAAILVALLTVVVFRAKGEARLLFTVAIRYGVVIGALFACLGSLT